MKSISRIVEVQKLLLLISVAESRTVSRETRLRFARQVSRDSRKESRNGKIGSKIAKTLAKFGKTGHIFSLFLLGNCNFYTFNVFRLQCFTIF